MPEVGVAGDSAAAATFGIAGMSSGNNNFQFVNTLPSRRRLRFRMHIPNWHSQSKQGKNLAGSHQYFASRYFQFAISPTKNSHRYYLKTVL